MPRAMEKFANNVQLQLCAESHFTYKGNIRVMRKIFYQITFGFLCISIEINCHVILNIENTWKGFDGKHFELNGNNSKYSEDYA
jgi:hypothetical protein